MNRETVSALREHRTPKGDPLETARLAGIMAAKRTADLIPLCHPLPLTHIDVQATLEETGVSLTAEVSTNAQTGVEMEASDCGFGRCSDDLRHVQGAGERHDDYGHAIGK